MTIYEKLAKIQQEIEVAKGRENKFDHFMYWSTDDILKALKPFLEEQKCSLVMNDFIQDFGGKTFVRVNGDLIDLEAERSSIQFTAAAQIEDTKGSMRAEQRTGSASSYARKRALSGLLLLDDADDADSLAGKRESKPRAPKPKEEKPKEPKMKPIGTCDFCDAPFFEKSEVRKCTDGRLICLECLKKGANRENK